ncbi:MAG: hypothetical protein IGS03_16200 [Candidatus Sericytochromatia bacterium]|nr:hypothetical protein [Candidatus Sericytochromatia bacterium]
MTWTWIAPLSRYDLKLIGRDRFLLLMFGFNFIMAALLRWLLPWAHQTLSSKGLLPSNSLPFSLADCYPLLMAYFSFFEGAVIAGIIFGFMLLDEKDETTLQALLVTPVPIQHYLLYRIGLSYLAALAFIWVMYLGIGLVPLAPGPLLLLSLGGALTAPLVLLFFALAAENKVQGFAMSKFTGIAGWVILFGWFVPEPWQWLLGVFPPFWISQAYWLYLVQSPHWWLCLLPGFGLQLLLTVGLLWCFQQQVYQNS